MRMLLLSIFFALHSAAVAGVTTAPEPKLLTRFYPVSPSMCCGPMPEEAEPWPFSLDDPTQANRPGRVNAREVLEGKGVQFPPGSLAVYLRGDSLLVVRNTAENLNLVGRIIANAEDINQIKQIEIETRLVEFRPDAEGRLEMRGTFAELQKTLGPSVRTVAVSSLISKSGNRSVAESGEKPPARVEDDWKDARSPTEGSVLEIEPQLRDDGSGTDLRYVLNYDEPAAAGRAAQKVRLKGSRAMPHGEIVVANTFTLPGSNKKSETRRYAVLLRCEKTRSESQQSAVEARLVEYPLGAESRLAMRGSFADLQQALGDILKTVAVTSLISRNGNTAVADSGRAGTNVKPQRGQPPDEGSVLEIEPQIGPDGSTTDVNFALNYAAPGAPGGVAPRVQFFVNRSLANGEIVVGNTFSLPDPAKDGGLRHYAVLIRCEILDTEGKPVFTRAPAPKAP